MTIKEPELTSVFAHLVVSAVSFGYAIAVQNIAFGFVWLYLFLSLYWFVLAMIRYSYYWKRLKAYRTQERNQVELIYTLRTILDLIMVQYRIIKAVDDESRTELTASEREIYDDAEKRFEMLMKRRDYLESSLS